MSGFRQSEDTHNFRIYVTFPMINTFISFFRKLSMLPFLFLPLGPRTWHSFTLCLMTAMVPIPYILLEQAQVNTFNSV